ncbi:MAG TPA: chaperone NapD [Acetobacteraceae bacterium]|jgi:nitrate reductase NapD|nr:chaperone NapD [Acetobacteraceae bacterium]
MTESHISSLVVHCQPAQAGEVARRILGLPGMEIHGGVEQGKLIVVLETASEGEIVERLNTVQLLDGVLAATLVFHQYDIADPSHGNGE